MKRKSVTAAELIDELSHDPAYLQRKALKEQELRQAHKSLVNESKELSKELKGIGVSIETSWDLSKIKDPDHRLVEVVLKHFRMRSYSAKFREGIARSLADFSLQFETLIGLFNAEGNEQQNVRWSISCALATAAAPNPGTINAIEKILRDTSLGRDRAPLLSVLKKFPLERKEMLAKSLRGDTDLMKDLKSLKLL